MAGSGQYAGTLAWSRSADLTNGVFGHPDVLFQWDAIPTWSSQMEILQMLHNSEINGSIEWFDGICTVRIGDPFNGIKANAMVTSLVEAEAWLHLKARELYPDSDYARATEPQ